MHTTAMTTIPGLNEEQTTHLMTNAEHLGRFTKGNTVYTFVEYAMAYLREYHGSFEFLVSVKEQMDERGYISAGQAAGVLNCAVSEFKRRQRDERPRQLELPTEPAFEVADGIYTIERPDGDYFTFRIRTATSGNMEGKRMVGYLAGPDNEIDFVNFGFMTEDGVRVWRRFQGGRVQKYADDINAVMTSRDAAEKAGQAYAMKSGRCRACGRRLTVPASLRSGYGPECAERMGL